MITKLELDDKPVIDKVLEMLTSETSPERTILIDGLPGVGKTLALVTIIKQLYTTNQSLKIAVGAPTSGALQCLTDQLSIEERLWIDTFDVPQLSSEDFVDKIKDSYDLFIIDNAGCINTAIAEGVLTLRSKAKVLMAGFLYERLPGLQSYCALVTRNPLDKTQFKYVDIKFKLSNEPLTGIQKFIKELTGEKASYKHDKLLFTDMCVTEDINVFTTLKDFNDSFIDRVRRKESVVRLCVNRFYEIKRGSDLNHLAKRVLEHALDTDHLTSIDNRNSKMRFGCKYSLSSKYNPTLYDFNGNKFKAIEVNFKNISDPFYYMVDSNSVENIVNYVFNSTEGRTEAEQKALEEEFYSNFVVTSQISNRATPNFSMSYLCNMQNALNSHWDHVYFDVGELLGSKYNREERTGYSNEIFNLLVIFAMSRAVKSFNVLTSKYV